MAGPYRIECIKIVNVCIAKLSQEESYSSKSGSINSRGSQASEISANSTHRVEDATLLAHQPEAEIPSIALKHVVSIILLL